jgi:putative phosphoribosyl transferase
MVFRNREDAGTRLAAQLGAYANQKNVLVLGIPRGGVPVAFEVARALNAPLDVCLARKLGVPDQEELAFGAIAAGGVRYLNQSIIDAAGISTEEIERITKEAARKLQDREVLFRSGKPPLLLEGRTVILIDDGIATGASMHASVLALRQMHPAKLVIAVPVAPIDTCGWLRPYVDELVCLDNPLDFYAVGQFYEYFPQVADEEVLDVLRRAASLPVQGVPSESTDSPRNKDEAGAVEEAWNGRRRDVSIAVDDVHLAGTLVIPQNAQGIVLFVHGSGSSRNSPRNRHVAEVLQDSGLATLLFDLLTAEEDEIDRWSAELRFNIGLLSRRLVQVTQWVRQLARTRDLMIGYFGASTGAAAALIAAAQLRNQIGAVVSRGGRPDLARDALSSVSTPTLLLVGSLDEDVLELNRQALAKLASLEKELRVIPGATHLFEEPGTLDLVAKAAADWFTSHLIQKPNQQAARADTVAGRDR